MALDHSRLGLENEFLENKSGRIFAFEKFTQQNLANNYTAGRFSLLTSAKFSVNIKRVTFQHNKEFMVFIFYFLFISWFYNDV